MSFSADDASPDTAVISLDNGIELAWESLKYEIKVKAKDNGGNQTKTLLAGISGKAIPGRMLAVMGPSGAGKSTFLSCISRRVRSSGLTGELLLDGTVLSPTSNALKHLSTFVMQEEALYGSLTVYENILYAAELSLPGLTRAERAAKIDLVIKEMGLERVRNTIIGTVVQRGVSGGEKRRTSVAAQLVTDPKILFLDEPTSGLDSAAAFKVMETIRNLARETKVTVIATIHQPSTETFQLFDDLLLLAPGGRPVYFGAREKAIDYFASLGKPCPPYFNPADHFLDLINTDFIEDREVAAKQIESLVAAWKESRLTETNDKLDKEMGGKQSPVVTKTMSFNKTMSFGKSMSFGTSAADAHKYKAGILLQTWILTRRTFVNYSRNIVGYGIRLFMYVAMAILMGLVWFRMGNGQAQIQDRFSVYFYTVAFLGFMSVAGIPSFLEDRQVFMRERANGLYGCLAHTFSGTLVTVPYMFLISLVFTAIAYPMIGLNGGASHFFQFLGFLFLGLLAAEFQAIWVSSLIPIFVAALAVTSFMNGFWMSVQGYFVRYINLPVWLRVWATQIDFQRYSFELMAVNDLRGQTFTCDQMAMPGTNTTGCFCMFPSSYSQEECMLAGDDVLRYYEIGGASTWNWVGVLLAIIFVYRVLFYITIRLQKPKVN